MQLFNKIKSLHLGKAKNAAKHPPSKVDSTRQTDPLTASPRQNNSSVDSVSTMSGRWTELCTRSDQWPQVPPGNLSSSDTASTTRTSYVDNLLYHTAKLHERHWKLHGHQGKYQNCKFPDDLQPTLAIGLIYPVRTTEQWDAIQHDLALYSGFPHDMPKKSRLRI